MIAEVSFPIALNKTFYYNIPVDLSGLVRPGLRILAPFGGRARVLGYVVSVMDENKTDLSSLPSLKEITAVMDTEPVFQPEKLMEAASYMAQRWYCPLPIALGAFIEPIPDGSVPAKILSRYFPAAEPPHKVKKFLDSEDKGSALFFGDRNELESLKAAAAYVLSKGIHCLFLVPDIPSALALYKIFPLPLSDQTALWHSRLTKKQRREAWTAIYSGEKKVVIGTKSSIFLPFPQGSVFTVLDHGNEMYRQFDRKPYYNTRNLVLKFSQIFRHKVLLAGGPPDAELYALYLSGGLELLDETVQGKMNCELVDMKKSGGTVLSPELKSAVCETMEKGRKAYVVASSKGVSPKSFCVKCYWLKRCSKCNSLMQVFEDEEDRKFYRCSYCARREKYSENCEKCAAPLTTARWFGVQRVVKELKKIYPDRRILKFDGEDIKKSIKKAGALIDMILARDFDILVGTSIILDSALVRDAGVVAFAEMHHGPSGDFRQNEKLLHSMMKASSLLSYPDSRLVIQSHEPESFSFLDFGDYRKFLNEELKLRKTFSYPPYSFMVKVDFLSADSLSLKNFSNSFLEMMRAPAKLLELRVIDHGYTHKLRFLKKEMKYSHSNIFKIEKDHYLSFMAFLAGLKPPKKIEISILTDM